MDDSRIPLLFSSFEVLKDIHPLLDSLITKVNEVKRTATSDSEVADQYLKGVVEFREEMEIVSERSSGFFVVGRKNIATLLEKQDGVDALNQMSGAIISAKNFLTDQGNALPFVTVLVSASQPSGQEPIRLLRSERDLENAATSLRAESEKLSQSQHGVLSRFDSFVTIYEDHLRAQLEASVGSTKAPLLPDDVETLSDILKLSFHKNPFNIFIDYSVLQKFAFTLALLNSPRSSNAKYVDSLQTLGTSWVDDSLQGCTDGSRRATQLGERYIHLLEGLRMFLEIELASLPAEEDLPAASKPISEPEPTNDAQYWFSTSHIPEKLRRMAERYLKKSDGQASERRRPHVDLTVAQTRETRQQITLLKDIHTLISKEIEREKTRKFSVALCGMVKSGKSLFLSAILGHRVLPSDELPSTAWPCRIRHVKGQAEAHLVLCEPNAAPKFQNGIKALRDKLRLKDRRRGNNDQHSRDDFTQEELAEIWDQLAPATRANWEIFKQPSFILPNEAHGDEDVLKLLAQMNDIVRLCRSFGIEIPIRSKDWPLMTVEFDSLRDEELNGIFEFYDLPGVGEFTESYFGFQELVNLVAREVNAIVPIVSLKEVSRSDWRTQLPQILLNSTGLREPSLIVCTHRDQVETAEHLETQIGRVLREFSTVSSRMSSNLKTLCVSCSSRLGLGAQNLLKLSQEGKPDYDFIFSDSVPEAFQSCAKYVLGNSRSSRRLFNQFSDAEWRDELQEALKESGLKEAMDQFSLTMAGAAHSEALLRGITSVARQMHKAATLQSETLLRMRRSKQECEDARENFHEAEDKIKSAQRSWKSEERRLRQMAMDAISRAFDELEQECLNGAEVTYNEAENQFTASHGGQYEIVEGGLRFQNQELSEELLRGVLKKMQDFLEIKKGGIIPRLRREVVDEQIKGQVDFLRAVLEVKLSDAQNVLIGRLDTEMGDIGVLIQQVPFRGFVERASHMESIWEELICWQKRRNDFRVVNKANAIRALHDDVIRPYVRTLRDSAETAFERMMRLGRDVLQGAVDALLVEEKERFELELSKKDQEPPQEEVASSVAAHLNFVSAEAALQRLEAELCACLDERPA